MLSSRAGQGGGHGAAPAPLLPLSTFALAYATFVVYGSLVPLEVRPTDLADGWRAFLAVPYLDLGMAERQDWVANGVLYFPLGALLAAALSPSLRRSSRAAGGAVAFLLSVALAIGVEFTQVFFVNRSVSMNDLLAEVLGAGAGVALWIFRGRWLTSAVEQIRTGSPGAVRAAMVLYVAALLVLSLFPFDLLLSADELRWKLANHPPRLLFDLDACNSALHCTVKLPLQALATVPIGMLWALARRPQERRWSPVRPLVAGLILGVAIETGQFFTVTGRADGLSVVAMGFGLAAGSLVGWWMVVHAGLERLLRRGRLVVVAATPCLLLALAWVNRLRLQAPVGVEQALDRLAATRMVPFYYHYYSPESVALVSFIAAVGMYAPVGVLVWMWRRSRAGAGRSGDFVASFWMATLLAALLWVGRLFLGGHQFADPTNILIAGAAAMMGYGAACLLDNWVAMASGAGPASSSPARVLTRQRHTSPLAAFTAMALLFVLLAAHPLSFVVTPVCLAYAALLFTFPSLWLVAVPLALPAFDLGGWTGWILVEEIDLVVLTTVAVLAIRGTEVGSRQPLTRSTRAVLVLLAVSYAVSAARGVMPLVPLDTNALADLLDPWNALRILRAVLLPLLLLPFLRDAIATDPRAGDRLAVGMLLGLVATAGSVAWERHLFVGMFDLTEAFRVSGPFSGMHVGGQQIDAYLVAALPFVAWFAIRPASWPLRALAVAALVLGMYAVVVTYTRWTYLTTVATALVLLGSWALARRNAGRLQRRALLAGLALVLAGFTALAAVSVADTFMRQRLGRLQHDAQERTTHWEDILAMRQGWSDVLFGRGLGTFPRAWWLRMAGLSQSATVVHSREDKVDMVQLAGGVPVYFEQRVRLNKRAPHVLRITARAPEDTAGVGVALCEKTVMYSRTCVNRSIRFLPGAQWQQHEVLLPALSTEAALDATPGPPVFLALFLSRDATVAEVRDVSLKDGAGRELLVNGDFSAGRDRWRYTADNHIAWHVKNLPVLVLFEQGWLGLSALIAVSGLVVVRLARALGRGCVEAAVPLAAFFAFWCTGASGSVLDSPRLGALFFLLAFWVVAGTWQTRPR